MVTKMSDKALKLIHGGGTSPLVVRSKHYLKVNKHIPHPIMDFMIKGDPYFIRLTLLPGGPDVPAPSKKAGRCAG